MNESAETSFVGVFDSGAGGVSVLCELVRELPCERFVYFGDSAHAPYGDQGAQRIRELSAEHVSRMIDNGAKAIVIACNTATSAAADYLRETYPFTPIVGIEPALKPAALAGGRILVLATEATVHLDKYHTLADKYGAQGNVSTLPCSGLVELVEAGDLDDARIMDYLQDKLRPFVGAVDSVVLGCTHYPFLKTHIAEVLGDVRFFDGAQGTARNLRRRLDDAGLLAPETQAGTVEFSSSVAGQAELYQRLFDQLRS